MIRSITYICMSYNYACYMPENRDGLLAQTRAPDRVLVTDDRSNDTKAEIEAIWAGVPGLEVIRNAENMGSMAHARRNCELVTTDAYITMSADDKLIDPTYLQTACEILDRHPNVSVVYGPHRSVHDGEVLAEPPKLDDAPYTILNGDTLRLQMAHANVVSSLCPVVRRSVHETVPPYPVRNELAGDWIHWYLLMTTGDYARINHPVCDYRVHPDGLYQTFMRSPTYGTALAEAYDALIAWPTLPRGDIQHLRRGRARARIRYARAADLPGVFLAEAKQTAAWRALGETARERVEGRITRLKRRFMGNES